MYIAKLLCQGVKIMERQISHPDDASDAFGGVTGPGYRIEVEELRDE